LNGFLGDLEQVRVTHSIPESYLAGSFLNLSSAITPEGLSQPETINDIVLALLSQIEVKHTHKICIDLYKNNNILHFKCQNIEALFSSKTSSVSLA